MYTNSSFLILHLHLKFFYLSIKYIDHFIIKPPQSFQGGKIKTQ